MMNVFEPVEISRFKKDLTIANIYFQIHYFITRCTKWDFIGSNGLTGRKLNPRIAADYAGWRRSIAVGLCLPYFTWIRSGSASVSKMDVATCPLLRWWTITSCLSPAAGCRELRRFRLLELRSRTATMVASTTSNRHALTALIITGDTFNTSTPNPVREKRK